MFRTPSRNLAIIVFLAVQAMATQCMPCVCPPQKGERIEPVLAAGPIADDSGTRCFICQTGAESQQLKHVRPADRQVQVLAIAEPLGFRLHGNATVCGTAIPSNYDLTPLDAKLLQVFLE